MVRFMTHAKTPGAKRLARVAALRMVTEGLGINKLYRSGAK